MIRAVGGEVSWDSSVGMGATFSQSDGSITHQVMDRDPNTVGEMLLGRFYIQPQWIFDSINRRELWVEKFPGIQVSVWVQLSANQMAVSLIRLWIGTQTLWEKWSLEDSTSSLSGFLTVSIGERSAGRRIMYWEKLFLPTYLRLCQRGREESETMFHLNKRLLKRVKYRTWKMKIEMKRIVEMKMKLKKMRSLERVQKWVLKSA